MIPSCSCQAPALFSERAGLACLVALLATACFSSHERETVSGWPDCTGDPATAAVLDMIESVTPPSSGDDGRVRLADGMTYFLDADDTRSTAYAEIIESMRGLGNPIYLEYDRETRLVVDVGLPESYRVLTIAEVDDGALVELDVSAAIHPLDDTLVCYEFFLDILETALAEDTPVWITHDSLYRIIDVRPAI